MNNGTQVKRHACTREVQYPHKNVTCMFRMSNIHEIFLFAVCRLLSCDGRREWYVGYSDKPN